MNPELRTRRPELVVPAGDLERLKVAIRYGADAVYVGAPVLSMRAYAPNFTLEQLEEGVSEAHRKGVRVYVAVNILAHNRHLEEAAALFRALERLAVDSLIISDPGLWALARELTPGIPVHLSTQAGVTNWRSALFWKNQGVKRINLARELSLNEIREIREKVPVELELFVHGAMCVAYSGRCLLSAYFTGRGANRGECTHSCRWSYTLLEKERPGEPLTLVEGEENSVILSSRDLCMIGHLPDLAALGVEGFKIEGRMKGIHYVATVTKIYREALDALFSAPDSFQCRQQWLEELEKVSNRAFTTGFYLGYPLQVAPDEKETYRLRTRLAGVILMYDAERKMALVEQRNRFMTGDELEVFGPRRDPRCFKVEKIFSVCGGDELESAPHPRQQVWIPVPEPLHELDLLRIYT